MEARGKEEARWKEEARGKVEAKGRSNDEIFADFITCSHEDVISDHETVENAPSIEFGFCPTRHYKIVEPHAADRT